MNEIKNSQHTDNQISSASWYVVYTKPRWEKKVASILARKGIDHYCPLNKVLRQWSDRKKTIEEPLFSGYVFLKTTDSEKWRIKEVDGILNYVYWLGKPAIVPEHEIETIKRFLNEHEIVQVNNTQFKSNDRVKILTGAFINTQATVIAQKGKNVILEIPALQLKLTAQLKHTALELIT